MRKDIHNVVVPVDLSSAKDVSLVVEGLQNFIKRKVPIRFGIVPSTRSPAAKDQAKVAYHLLDTYGLGGLMAYLETVRVTAKTLTTSTHQARHSIRVLYQHPHLNILTLLSRAVKSAEIRQCGLSKKYSPLKI